MTKKFILIISLAFFYSFSGIAQSHDHEHSSENHRTCGTVDYMQNLKESSTSVKSNIENAEKDVQKWVKENPNFNQQKALVIIPVVVHVLYAYNFQNISDAQVQSQIEVLNADYRRLNADAINTPSLFSNAVADCEIQFCLAMQDPNGNYTNGITRTQTTKTSFNINNNEAKYDALGGKNIWDRTKYLNIWVVPAIDDNGASGILGYAQMPGGPSSTDGVVIQYRNFGSMGTAIYPFNKGRTATHEVGHWLSLYHVWGDDGNACWGTDYCNDTPNQADENYGCPTYPQVSCNNTSDMYMNYMDYTDDACMNAFTNTQKARMWATLNGHRASIKTSIGCVSVDIDDIAKQEIDIKIYPNPSNGKFTLEFTQLSQSENIQIRAFNSLGKEVFNKQSTFTKGSRYEIDLGNLPSGLYQILIETSKGIESRKVMIQ